MAAEDERPTDRPERKLTVAEILRRGAAAFVKSYPSQAAPQVQSTLAKLSLCRTKALGGRRYRCHTCEQECVLYNSCGDRHCPTCGGAKRADWFDSSRALLLDGVPYYQVVFTLPSELSRLALGNRRAIYTLLFQSAWRALRSVIESEQGYDSAALMVLHTWNQKLDAHAHVHAVVPGGGPATDGSGWRFSQRAGDARSMGHYLVDADLLRAAYRQRFLRGLTRLRRQGELKLQGEFAHLQNDDQWKRWINDLQSTNWVSYIEPPPAGDCHVEQVVKYLARYLTGGPISDARIVSADDHQVTFLARAGTTPGGDAEQIEITLPTVEFVRRWCLHVLPRGYTKTRRYGGWSGRRRHAYLELCSKQLEAAGAPLPPEAADFNPFIEPAEGDQSKASEEDDRHECCPQCGGPMILQESQDKPSWRDIMSSSSRPAWYRLLIGK